MSGKYCDIVIIEGVYEYCADLLYMKIVKKPNL